MQTAISRIIHPAPIQPADALRNRLCLHVKNGVDILLKKGIIKTLFFIVMLVLAILLGKAAGNMAAGVNWLSWLGAYAKFGISTVNINLSVLQITFGMMININVAQTILLLAAIFIYTKIK